MDIPKYDSSLNLDDLLPSRHHLRRKEAQKKAEENAKQQRELSQQVLDFTTFDTQGVPGLTLDFGIDPTESSYEDSSEFTSAGTQNFNAAVATTKEQELPHHYQVGEMEAHDVELFSDESSSGNYVQLTLDIPVTALVPSKIDAAKDRANRGQSTTTQSEISSLSPADFMTPLFE